MKSLASRVDRIYTEYFQARMNFMNMLIDTVVMISLH